VRTQHLSTKETEYLRWKAERWMKVRHMPAAFRDDPWFILRRSVLGLEDERKAFERYKAIRKNEREYV